MAPVPGSPARRPLQGPRPRPEACRGPVQGTAPSCDGPRAGSRREHASGGARGSFKGGRGPPSEAGSGLRPGMTAVAQLTAGTVSLDGSVLPMGVAQHVFVSALDEELTPAEAAPRL